MENRAEQYYPTYTFKKRDVLLIEFEEAQSIANSQTKLYGQVANILIAVVTVLIPLFFETDKGKSQRVLNIINNNSILFSAIIFCFGAIILRYFVELQKQITFNARKVVTLRSLLGLDYGTIQLTLPNWRVEGAVNPFAIKFFTGWFSFGSIPFWTLTIGVNVIWGLSTFNKSPFTFNYIFLNEILYVPLFWYYGNIIITLFYTYIFRTNLNDRHETNYLHFTKALTRVFGLRLVDNFEYVLYRAKLSYIELDRLQVKYDSLKKILIQIEDREFEKHKGISFKALFRGILSQFRFFRRRFEYIKSGGSTITMQLNRTLFIPSNQNRLKRKLFEILFSIWLNNQFSKEEILKMYISSVRYEKGVLGLANAIKYFFGDIHKKELSNEEAFFLVERLSNITSKVKWDRIKHLAPRTALQIEDIKLERIYKGLIENGKLKEE